MPQSPREKLTDTAARWGRDAVHYLRSQPLRKLILLGAGVPLALGFVLFIFLVLGILTGGYGHLPTRGELAQIETDDASSIFAEDGALLGKYYTINRVSVPLDAISPYVTQALIATEDARFFEHQGIDLRALVRVAVRTVLMGDRSGGGGSTISQQLAKQLYPRQQYDRLGMLKVKLREMIIASRLEDVYSKQELLNLYLNTVPFGEEAYGIEVAAGRFFNKHASELNLQEAAILVGLLKANTTYSPRAHPEKSVGRRNVVLSLMARNGSITEEEAQRAAALPLELRYTRDNDRVGSAAHFRQRLRADVQSALADLQHPDGRPYDPDRDGLRIFVSIDSRLQRMAEESVREQLPRIQQNLADDWKSRQQAPWEEAFTSALRRSDRYTQLKAEGMSEVQILEEMRKPRHMTVYDWRQGAPVDTLMRPVDSLRHYFTLLNAGLLATDPATGVVRAWVGGVDYRSVQFDHVSSRRQVGSTIKPVVYATALAQGVLPCEYTSAEQATYVDYNDYSPGNPNNEYTGAYSMRGGLAKSVNTVAVSLAVRSGLPSLAQQINRMGVAHEVQPIPSIALGTVEASLAEMNLVYSAFANQGRRPERLHYLDRIEDANGKVLVSFERPRESQPVLDERVAQIATYLMAGVVNSGTGARLRSTYGIQGALAGKTGTTQNQSDGWFLGFTPKLVIGSWVGAEYPAVHFRTLSRGSATATALPIWGTFLRKVQRSPQLKAYHGGSFPELDEMTLAELDCPDYLEEMPIFADLNLSEEIARALEQFDPEVIREKVEDKRQRSNESATEYAARIAEELLKDDRREERRQERKQSWIKRLFGKDKD
ncbi:penicillin-binding protein 1A [Lewinella marina]|uniref:Penicillin-binding protein n=1 Tax=Neolewinella marina TaxID=438751 RepID=A0A2G0CEU0_9BACT|nr:transglycosylase domain-containing protein [Neolewinella marina]NJB87233.1 penicillin-binding protein 1A [Neolewinella marina]PHK98440.1 penicillin-binding protein [Neolewinella marina]